MTSNEFRTDCPVCLDVFDDRPIAAVACGHVFHESCVSQWNKRECPLCRMAYNKSKPIRLFLNCSEFRRSNDGDHLQLKAEIRRLLFETGKMEELRHCNDVLNSQASDMELQLKKLQQIQKVHRDENTKLKQQIDALHEKEKTSFSVKSEIERLAEFLEDSTDNLARSFIERLRSRPNIDAEFGLLVALQVIEKLVKCQDDLKQKTKGCEALLKQNKSLETNIGRLKQMKKQSTTHPSSSTLSSSSFASSLLHPIRNKTTTATAVPRSPAPLPAPNTNRILSRSNVNLIKTQSTTSLEAPPIKRSKIPVSSNFQQQFAPCMSASSVSLTSTSNKSALVIGAMLMQQKENSNSHGITNHDTASKSALTSSFSSGVTPMIDMKTMNMFVKKIKCDNHEQNTVCRDTSTSSSPPISSQSPSPAITTNGGLILTFEPPNRTKLIAGFEIQNHSRQHNNFSNNSATNQIRSTNSKLQRRDSNLEVLGIDLGSHHTSYHVNQDETNTGRFHELEVTRTKKQAPNNFFHKQSKLTTENVSKKNSLIINDNASVIELDED